LAEFLVLIAENRYMTTGARAGLKQAAPRLRVVADSLHGVIYYGCPLQEDWEWREHVFGFTVGFIF
jgi:hypothetical protein